MPNRELTLTSYFVIKNGKATEASIMNNSLASLSETNDYIIERYKEAAWADGNYRYVYKIYNSKQQEANIKVGDWSINSINSNLCFNPSIYIAFDLRDKNGSSSLDKQMPYFKANSQRWEEMNSQDLKVSGAGIEAIVRMLDLAKRAMTFKSWYYFLEDISLQKLKLNHSSKIAEFQQNLNLLQTQLEELKTSIEL